MTSMNRRRFLTISAVAGCAAALPASAATLYRWRGIALGAQAEIYIDHPQAEAITARAAAEIARLEGVFSLYRTDSALMRLNSAGELAEPPFELLECLSLAGRAHAATDGLFDPTVQPLWALYAARFSAGTEPGQDDIARAVSQTGWARISFDPASVRLAPGMALTLNGIAQGFIADRVAGLLRAEGLDQVLINTGELRALGARPGGGAWPVSLSGGGAVELDNRALATSSPLGTAFDAAGRVGHILDPRSGRPAPARWRSVSISAPSAGLADALSTAACLMPDRAVIERAAAAFDGVRIEALA